MRKLVNSLVSSIKKDKWTLDDNIPSSYLLKYFHIRILMLIRGVLKFLRIKPIVFLGKNSTIRCTKKFHYQSGLTIDRGCYIDALSIDGIRFGENVSIGKSTTIECTGSLQDIGKGLIVGNNVGLGSHGFWGCAGGIEVGDNTIFGNFVSLHSENHKFNDKYKLIKKQGVIRDGIKIGSNCWLGSKSTILDGVILEDGCIVAAGAVLKKGVYKANGIYGGVPAKLLKKRC